MILWRLGVDTLLTAGVCNDVCMLRTAGDAYRHPRPRAGPRRASVLIRPKASTRRRLDAALASPASGSRRLSGLPTKSPSPTLARDPASRPALKPGANVRRARGVDLFPFTGTVPRAHRAFRRLRPTALPSQLTPSLGSPSLTVGPDEKVFRRLPSGKGAATATTSGPPGALDRPLGRDRLDRPAPRSAAPAASMASITGTPIRTRCAKASTGALYRMCTRSPHQAPRPPRVTVPARPQGGGEARRRPPPRAVGSAHIPAPSF